MQIRKHTSLATVVAAALASAGLAQNFHEPVRIEAAGQPITTEIGHSAPYVYDFDRDGVRDLLVGQFGQGKLQLYRNKGTNRKPVYEKLRWFEAGGEVATTPAG